MTPSMQPAPEGVHEDVHDGAHDGVSGRITHQQALDKANAAQLRASDPRASVFVSASAGSGKTKLLIDRLLRLMLPLECTNEEGQPVLVEGSSPSRILCLTYTKAAAAEMAHRLQQHLGRWVSLSDEDLGATLRGLNVPDNRHTRERARGLFLKVLDAPGGLQIETIHAFCQSLLRRFPLEAALDPHFVLMEDTDSRLALRRALEDSLARNQNPVQVLAGLVKFEDLMELLGQFNTRSGLLHPLLELWQHDPARLKEAYQALLETGPDTPEQLEKAACQLEDEAGWQADVKAVLPHIPAGRQNSLYIPLLEWLAQPVEERDPGLMAAILLKKEDGEPKALTSLLNKPARAAAPELEIRIAAEASRQQDIRERVRAGHLLEANMAFLSLALPVMMRFAEEKRDRGAVDYGDLIARTRDVLQEPGAAWVLYKLDGGIDHLLLDEVQDNSALQWEIAGALTADFFSGAGRREESPRPRTIFAVGDFKQSIYSFQGAAPDQFHKWREEFARRVENAGLPWEDPQLTVSFRSLAPVLEFVDAVFADGEETGVQRAIDGLTEQGNRKSLEHNSARSGGGGRVELWPPVPADQPKTGGKDQPEGEGESPIGDDAIDPWRAPQGNEDKRRAEQRLADELASHIRLKIGQPLQPGTDPLKAGDVMILVRKRSPFLRVLIRALKTKGVPVASFLRAGLVEQAAVQDLMTLCETLLLPQDDLSLASVLTSPLGGLSDESLMALATANGTRHELGRKGTPLWSLLGRRHAERPDWQAAWERLGALYRRVDYDTPYAILMQALGVQGGRARLLARLGQEAAEPVDELLTVALAYEAQHPPSLQGFLHWLKASTVDSQREAEAEIDAVRIMTVHRSKGLQARLVILPDTTGGPGKPEKILWEELEDGSAEGGVASLDIMSPDNVALVAPLWAPGSMATKRTKAFAGRELDLKREEDNRLLYVALTRASDALLVCGWARQKPPKGVTSWYEYCEAGMKRLAKNAPEENTFEVLPFEGEWGGEKLVLDVPVDAAKAPAGEEARKPVQPDLPDWMGRAPDWQVQPAPQEDALARPLAPSRPENAAYGPLPAARSPLEIMREGLVIPQPASRRQDAMERGILVHRLLQFLPDVPQEEREGRARDWLAHAMPGLAVEDVSGLASKVTAIVGMEALAPLFGPGSRAEQGISGTLGEPGTGKGRVVLGQVDRFRFDGDTVWLCDYKTGRPPARSGQVPSAYQAQMASYRQVMAGLYPGRPVRCFLVWVDGPIVTELPASLLDGADLRLH